MGLLQSVSKTVQRIVVGDSNAKKKQKPEIPAMRMIITDEPRPSHKEQVRSWINGGDTPPDRAVRIQQRIHELHTTDYMSFPQGEGTLGVHRKVNGFKRNPHDIDGFYSESILGNKARKK